MVRDEEAEEWVARCAPRAAGQAAAHGALAPLPEALNKKRLEL